MKISKPILNNFMGAFISEMDVAADYEGHTEINLQLIPSDTKIAEYFFRMFRGDLPSDGTMGLHLVEKEWLCIWCNSINSLHGKHCSQCGAPRGFILGR